MVEPLSKRVADLGWHVQFNVDGEMIDEMASMLWRLPTPMVFDHLAHPPLPAGIDHSSHKIVRELIDKGRTWVKVSGAYSNSKIGPPSYPEATKIAQAFVKAAPGSGEATGRTLACPTATSRTTRSCSTS